MIQVENSGYTDIILAKTGAFKEGHRSPSLGLVRKRAQKSLTRVDQGEALCWYIYAQYHILVMGAGSITSATSIDCCQCTFSVRLPLPLFWQKSFAARPCFFFPENGLF